MQALILEDVKKFVLRDEVKPVPKENEVLVQVGAVGICRDGPPHLSRVRQLSPRRAGPADSAARAPTAPGA